MLVTVRRYQCERADSKTVSALDRSTAFSNRYRRKKELAATSAIGLQS